MQNKSSILLIYTGGTIGMINDPITGELKSFDFKHMYDQIATVSRVSWTQAQRSSIDIGYSTNTAT